MSRESERLHKELEPPAALEERIVAELLARELIGPGAPRARWRTIATPIAAAACAAFFAVGFVLGGGGEPDRAPLSPLTGAETDLYALLLYETEGYDSAEGREAIARYGEYSAWVAEARRRGQFVTGEDLDVERGWRIDPSSVAPAIEPATSIAENAPLSGIFFVRAASPEAALDLARELPHLRHGGRVLVQKTIPTDAPPPTQQGGE